MIKLQKRSTMKGKTSKKVFSKTVDRTHKFNKKTSAGIKRGGIRL